MDGRALSARLMPELRAQVDQLKSEYGCTPSLVAILVCDDPASRQYVRNKERAAADLGCESRTVRMASAVDVVRQRPQRRHIKDVRLIAQLTAQGQVQEPIEAGQKRRQRRRILPWSMGTLHSMHSARRAHAARLLPRAG